MKVDEDQHNLLSFTEVRDQILEHQPARTRIVTTESSLLNTFNLLLHGRSTGLINFI